MAGAYAGDLRQRVVAAARDEGRRGAKPMRGGAQPTIRDGGGAALRRLVEAAAVPVVDGLAAPRGPCARLDGAGVTHRHLPRCSPAPSPIEPVRAELEGLPRKAAARTVDGLHAARGPASAATTPPDARGFFRPAGHARPS
jgi:hypothetical protein